MEHRSNELGQPIGAALSSWQGAEYPPELPLKGRCCWLEPLVISDHAQELYQAFAQAPDASDWTYMSYEPFHSFEAYCQWLQLHCLGDDPLFYAILDAKSEAAVGVASFLNIAPLQGSVEVGYVHFSPQLQRTIAATEAMFLMMEWVFDELGYRRLEWKCDALNEASRRAALRLGFAYEGTFRNHLIYKGRNRDTAWFSMLDDEWPARKSALLGWLHPDNFDEQGTQRQPLGYFQRGRDSEAR